jgi:hypothetical protein
MLPRTHRGLNICRLYVIGRGVVGAAALPTRIVMLLLLLVASVWRLNAHPRMPTGTDGVAAEFGGGSTAVEDGVTR